MRIHFFHKPLARPEGEHLPRRALTFFTAALCLISCFVTSSLPIPMMSVWAHDLALTNADIAMTVVAYFGGCVATLLFFARLSNFLGRKPVVLLSLIFGSIASFLFANAQAIGTIEIGRFLQGLSCGFASSASMSWVVDTAPPKRAWLGTALTSAGPNIGLSVGTLLAGVIIAEQFMSNPHLFEATIALLITCAVLVLFCTETVRLGTEPLGQVLIPKLAIPHRLMRIFFISAAGFIGTWGMGSFFQGFAARVSSIVFGDSSAFLAATAYLCLIVPNAVCGLLAGRFRASFVAPFVITVFLISGLTVLAAIHFELGWLFIISVAFCGAAGGSYCSAGLKLLLADATLKERAGSISALYFSAYVGSGVPNFVVGMLAARADMDTISMGYAVWVAATWVLVMGAILLVRRNPTPAEALRFGPGAQV